MDWTTESLPPETLNRVVNGAAFKFWRKYGGDLEEIQAEAYFYAGVASLSFNGTGTVWGWINYTIGKGLLERQRTIARKAARLTQNELHQAIPVRAKWEDWCRQLANDLSDDAATVINVALDAPGEVFNQLIACGWSVPRILSALDTVRGELQ